MKHVVFFGMVLICNIHSQILAWWLYHLYVKYVVKPGMVVICEIRSQISDGGDM